MSVLVKKGSTPPEGAVIISKEEALRMQWDLILNWKPKSDVWPFRYGMASLALGSALSAFMIVTQFRRKLKLRNFGQFAMYLPNVVIPAATLPILHQRLISDPILVQTDCPVCIQLRSIFLQNGMGIIYPLILSPISGFMLATSFATTRIPELSLSNTKAFYNIYRSILLPFSSRLLGLSLFHTILAIAVTEAEARSFFKIQKILHDNRYKNDDNGPLEM